MWSVAGALLLAGVLIPGRLSRVHYWWMELAHAISRITSPIVIGVTYFAMLTPIGGLLRAFGRNPLRHPEHNGGFWLPPPSGGRSDLGSQF
jgi:hypothetical protein